MKKYRKEQQDNKKIESIVCNQCGREIPMMENRMTEGVCSIEQHWGYESNKDGECHLFDLCEECYDRLVATFAIPIVEK